MQNDEWPAWNGLPRENLIHIFESLPLHERCLTVGAVCNWWRAVSLESSSSLLLDLNLNRVPIFCKRTRELPDFYQQRASFTAWLLRRRSGIRRLALTAERWEDDSQGVVLRLAVAEIIAPQLEVLRLVCTETGRATSAFLSGAARLLELQLDFWGCSNGLPRVMANCAALAKLRVQCSSGLERYKVLASLRSLQDLSVSDCDWQSIPVELLQLPLTRLHMRFADFIDTNWLPKDAGRLAHTLQELSVPGCQISAVPEELTQLSALSALYLDRNYIRHLPCSLSCLSRLQTLSCEGCSALRELPAALAATLPLHSINLLHTGVLHLPGPSFAWLFDEGDGHGSACSRTTTTSGGAGYLQQLTELRWGVAEWEQGGCVGSRRVAASGALSDADGLPDLSSLLQASGLQVLQLAHVPVACESALAALRQGLLELRHLQVNSAIMLG